MTQIGTKEIEKIKSDIERGDYTSGLRKPGVSTPGGRQDYLYDGKQINWEILRLFD